MVSKYIYGTILGVSIFILGYGVGWVDFQKKHKTWLAMECFQIQMKVCKSVPDICEKMNKLTPKEQVE